MLYIYIYYIYNLYLKYANKGIFSAFLAKHLKESFFKKLLLQF